MKNPEVLKRVMQAIPLAALALTSLYFIRSNSDAELAKPTQDELRHLCALDTPNSSTTTWYEDVMSHATVVSFISQTAAPIDGCMELIATKVKDISGQDSAIIFRLEDSNTSHITSLKDALMYNKLQFRFSSIPNTPIGIAPVELNNRLLDIQFKGVPLAVDLTTDTSTESRHVTLIPYDGTQIVLKLIPGTELVDLGPKIGTYPLSEIIEKLTEYLKSNFPDKNVSVKSNDTTLLSNDSDRLKLKSEIPFVPPEVTQVPSQETVPIATSTQAPAKDTDNALDIKPDKIESQPFEEVHTVTDTIIAGNEPLYIYTFTNTNGNKDQTAIVDAGDVADAEHKYDLIMAMLSDPLSTYEKIMSLIEKTENEADKAQDSWWFNFINNYVRPKWAKIYPEATRYKLQNSTLPDIEILRTYDAGKTILTIGKSNGQIIFYKTNNYTKFNHTYSANSTTTTNTVASENIYNYFKWAMANKLEIAGKPSQGFYLVPGEYQHILNHTTHDRAEAMLTKIAREKETAGVFILKEDGSKIPFWLPTGTYLSNVSNRTKDPNMSLIMIEGTTYFVATVNVNIPLPYSPSGLRTELLDNLSKLYPGGKIPSHIMVLVPVTEAAFMDFNLQYNLIQSDPSLIKDPQSYMPPALNPGWLGHLPDSVAQPAPAIRKISGYKHQISHPSTIAQRRKAQLKN